ncbi:hypothetical protein K439DRAFT_1362533, partial [Ramaria rubella]
TKRMSASKISWIFEVIPVIDLLTATLDQYASDKKFFPVVRSAAAKGCEILNKYYSLTDDSVVYRIAMILHPRYKTFYFQWQKWPDLWIDTAVKLLHQQWEKHYKPAGTKSLTTSEVSTLFHVLKCPCADETRRQP